MVCCPPDIPESYKKQIYQVFQSSSGAVDILFSSGRTSWPSGHYRKCTSDLSQNAVRGVISAVISQITDFSMQNHSTDNDCNYFYYHFDTRPNSDGVDGNDVRGQDWGESGVRICVCKDTETAELIFKEWLEVLYPGWTPFPVDVKECGVGQYALEQDYGLVYWVRYNIFVKLDIDDGAIPRATVYRLARAIDAHLKAGSVMIGNDS
ncbi:hypothetical protein TWF106_008297 [Orbilia oligospora]|uniref:Uncharacterized protein n=1 Tax=Orbilia oligospora TaxID=2813651 RepID=A0A6G1MHV7_ORBOL|nr:hypothetical protein TWF788_006736 [Orbilia oligospora]KAF3208220.1 hypothetical protein TWF679_007860 [Orbilia oligospora]KAF3227893.1 hypothetical protein TWF106_008297 [Orbilia oligospora]KAF3231518.1 hypothetical protein TWF191_005587 [Orbilia oligospora]KAF3257671.1 hypothetical protein TWF192_000961 [Orbilia oligospora]